MIGQWINITHQYLRVSGWVDYGHFYLRPKRELANDFCKYNTPLDNLKFILSLKTVGYHTYTFTYF